jgi:hypothetical protein
MISGGYWLSTKSPPNIFRLGYHSAEAAAFLRANNSIDAAILAEQLGMGIDQVKAYQRRLGLRECVPSGGRKR